ATSDGSCKTQHTEVSFDLPEGKSARTPPSTFLFLSSIFKQRALRHRRQQFNPDKLSGPNALP
ncbi:hypothetical protein, partial [Bosea sp. BH3]|uniref:hypothetical protein n=1 Tax=Bosea sp. BH3 TaxID=2871701 RepID=UPI0021CB4AAA